VSAVLAAGASVAPMLESSLDEIVRAERQLYEFPWTRGNFKDSIAAGYCCVELRRGDRPGHGELLGYAVMMLTPGEAHLLNLSVLAAAQRRGYGSGLLGVLAGVARVRGAARLLLEVRPSNAAARQLYARAGFERIGTRPGYYPARDGREDAIVLSLDL